VRTQSTKQKCLAPKQNVPDQRHRHCCCVVHGGLCRNGNRFPCEIKDVQGPSLM